VKPASCDDATGGGGAKYAVARCKNQYVPMAPAMLHT
jgi:hypothetical protein